MLLLKQIRNDQGLSLSKLSALSGVPQRTIEDAEHRQDCRMSTAYKLAKALNVSLDALWRED